MNVAASLVTVTMQGWLGLGIEAKWLLLQYHAHECFLGNIQPFHDHMLYGIGSF